MMISNPPESGKFYFQSCYIILLKMSSFQQKLRKIQKRKEKTSYGPYTGKKQPLKTVAEEALMSDLQDKDFKSVSLDMIKVLKETMPEE